MHGSRLRRLPGQGLVSVVGPAVGTERARGVEPSRSLLRRMIAGLFDRCAHGGRMTPLRTLKGGVELWRCERCGAEVVFVEDSTWGRFEAAER